MTATENCSELAESSLRAKTSKDDTFTDTTLIDDTMASTGLCDEQLKPRTSKGTEAESESFNNIDTDATDPDNNENAEVKPDFQLPELISPKKKKRKNKKPKNQRGLGKPTGFEEYHADAPQTPDQLADDQELYALNIPFFQRILTAIQRFERTRKLTPERRDIFYKYLSFGGVDVGPNMFQGGQDTSSLDKSQLVAALAQTSISDDKHDLDSPTSKYAVDFGACMKSFLSRRAILLYGFDTYEHVSRVTTTLERFLDYLLQHDVCPEYQTDILQTRNFCRLATSELWASVEAGRWLPGNFNIACSTLFDGSYAHNYDGVTSWAPAKSDAAPEFIGFTPDIATQAVHLGIAGAASEAVFRQYLSLVNSPDNEGHNIQVVEVKDRAGFEITKIIAPTEACIEIYQSQSTGLQPVGRIHAKPWENPDRPPEDFTSEERRAILEKASLQEHNVESEDEEEYIFLIESVIQINLRVGMKLEATIRKLNCGIWFFDDFLRIFPSFDTFLCNELMVGWKEPRPLKGALDFVEDADEQQEDEGAADQAPGKEQEQEQEQGEDHTAEYGPGLKQSPPHSEGRNSS